MIANTPTFERDLQWGKVGETVIASWLRRKGFSVLPVYDVPLNTGKSPRLYTAYKSGHGELIAPDMLTMKGPLIQWVEAKRKTRFTWRSLPPHARNWQTGIDKRHYHHYLQVREYTNLPLWLMFLHTSATPSESDRTHNCEPVCPVGLFGGEILTLKKCIAHEDQFQREGRQYLMVYWNHGALKRIATLEEVQQHD